MPERSLPGGRSNQFHDQPRFFCAKPMNAPIAKIRQRVLLVLAATLACGTFTACDDDYHHHPRHTYRTYDRGYHRDYDRHDDYRYRRGYHGSSYYGSGYRRSAYYGPNAAVVHRSGPVRSRTVVYY